jgi:hypothetical protein
MLSVITKSTDVDLTTTSALKALALGATTTSTAQDTLLSNVARRASKWAESYIGKALTVQTYRETLPAYGRRSLMLSRTPVRAIKAVYDATDTGVAQRLGTTEYRLEDPDSGLITRDAGFAWSASMQGRIGLSAYGGSESIPLDPAPMPGQEYKPWLVDYVAGWTYAGVDTGSDNWSTENGATDTGRTLPEDIEQAVLLRAQMAWEGLDLEGKDSEALGDLSVKYTNLRSVRMDDPMPPMYEQLLIPYRGYV